MLSDEAVNEFRKLVKKKRGIELTESEARTMASDFLDFFKLVYKPISDNKERIN